MTHSLRKFLLTAHVAVSVGFVGAVAAFLALAVAGLDRGDAQVVHAAYLAMKLTTWFVILPLCVATLLTGIIQSLGTAWGLFRHYWVLVKLSLTVASTVVLLVHTKPVDYLAATTSAAALPDIHLRGVQLQLALSSGAALLVLLVATALSIYKPRGVTPYGWRKQDARRALSLP